MAMKQLGEKITVKPFEIIRVESLVITKAPNTHTLLYLTAVVNEKFRTEFVEDELNQKPIQVCLQEKEEVLLFCGITKKISIISKENTYLLKLTAVSHSIALDVKTHSRTYQQADLSYKDAMTQAISSIDGAAILDKATEGKQIEKLIVQYQETAWEFLMRMASHFNAVIIAEDKAEKPFVNIGMPQKADIGQLGNFRYSISKDVTAYRRAAESGIEKPQEMDFITYEIVTDSFYDIGDSATFMDTKLYVKKAIISKRNEIFYNRYTLTTEKGFYQSRIENDKLIGLALPGKVEEVEADTVKVRLDIDNEDDSAAGQTLCSFVYATMYSAPESAGFYCMPEIGERVRLYFPDYNGENAFVQGSIRTDFTESGDHGNPEIKYLRTKDGKEIKLLPKGIQIICKDDEIMIDLSQDNGISIISSKPISINAGDGADIQLTAEGSIMLSAEKEIDISCNGSKINMKSGTTKIRGSSIAEN